MLDALILSRIQFAANISFIFYISSFVNGLIYIGSQNQTLVFYT